MNTVTGWLVAAAVLAMGGLALLVAKLTGGLKAAWFGVVPWILTFLGAAVLLFYFARGVAAAG